MASLTARLGLKRPATTDPYVTQDQYDQYTLLDGFPGMFICTSTTRPTTWGAAHTGMLIYETDSSLTWRWVNGLGFLRSQITGMLADPSQITADFATANTAPQIAITSNVTVPTTNAGSTARRIEIIANWYCLDNGTATTLGASEVSIWRGAVRLLTQLSPGRPTTDTQPLDWGNGGVIIAHDNPAAGAQTYTLRINALATIGGTSTMRASAVNPAELCVKEIGL